MHPIPSCLLAALLIGGTFQGVAQWSALFDRWHAADVCRLAAAADQRPAVDCPRP